MTAEIVVHNTSAVALAADSAASISDGNTHKVFNNAEKLFELTKHHPVGLMIYGQAELQNVPWELIVKSYRKSLESKSFKTIKEYSTNFMEYVENFYQSLPEEVSAESSVASIYFFCRDTLSMVNNLTKSALEDNPSLEKTAAILDNIDELIGAYNQTNYLIGFSEEDLASAKAAVSALLEKLATTKEFWGKAFDLKNDIWKEIFIKSLELTAMRIIKEDPYEEDITGVVLAGFGDDEHFPSIIAIEVFGIFDGKVRYRLNKDKCMTNYSSGVIPFAQDSEVTAFMEGVSSNAHDSIKTLIDENAYLMRDLLNKSLSYIDDDQKRTELETALAEEFVSRLQSIIDNFKNELQENNIRKVVRMIRHLPKNELAYMAESLVNLTAFKRKVSHELDSVGGPIDVAVISKVDGFVWVKRKHYFPIELNARYHMKDY